MDENNVPYVRGSDTSKDAADSMRSAAAALRERVFRLIDKAEKGLTCDEIEVELGDAVRQSTVSARVRELVLKGRLVDSGKRRLTRSNRKAVAWIVLVKGAKLPSQQLDLKRARADRLFKEIEGLPRVVRTELIEDILDNWCGVCGSDLNDAGCPSCAPKKVYNE